MRQRTFFDFYRKYGIYVILLALILFFSIFARQFLSVDNMLNIARQVSMFGIAVVAVTLIMISGGADLSVGGQIAVNGIVTGMLIVYGKVPWPIAVLLALLMGTLFSALNGYLAVKLNMFPMIVTLGSMLALNGLAYVISGGYPIFGLPETFIFLGQGYIGPVPVPVIVFALIVALAWFILNKTWFGRYVYALGGNPEAARLTGIDTEWIRVLVYALGGLVISISAVIMLARNNSAQPTAAASYPFDCMTAAVLGGISFAGGEGTIGGAIVGVFIIGILNNGMLLMGIDSNWQGVVKGLVLVAAVGIDSVQHKARKVKARTA